MAQALVCPSDQFVSPKPLAQNGDNKPHKVIARWSQYVGKRPVYIVRNLKTAREKLLQALAIVSQEPVLLPANATHPLVEAVIQSKAAPVFGALDENLALCHQGSFRIAWVQPGSGLPTGSNITAEITVIDHGDSLPGDRMAVNDSLFQADVAIFGFGQDRFQLLLHHTFIFQVQ